MVVNNLLEINNEINKESRIIKVCLLVKRIVL